uniref:Uncharacterized protein n=1 Tax=Timema monikensis TaxID=170555 RepID=A0A7R9HU05_9NEOP|nr:unnamed protein product [Timema monikensis]
MGVEREEDWDSQKRAFSADDFQQVLFTSYLERRLVRYLCQVKESIEELKRSGRRVPLIRIDTPNNHTKEGEVTNPYGCIVKGMGLVVAVQNRRATFYIYPRFPQQPSDFFIEIKGPSEDFGSATISIGSNLSQISTISKQFSTNPRPCNIVVSYKVNITYVRVTYVPCSEGPHELSVLQNEKHVVGSPYHIIVDKSSEESLSSSKWKKLSEEEEDNSKSKKELVHNDKESLDSKFDYRKKETINSNHFYVNNGNPNAPQSTPQHQSSFIDTASKSSYQSRELFTQELLDQSKESNDNNLVNENNDTHNQIDCGEAQSFKSDTNNVFEVFEKVFPCVDSVQDNYTDIASKKWDEVLQFNMWPSDIEFGTANTQNNFKDLEVDFESIISAPNLEEALKKLEQGLQKGKEIQNNVLVNHADIDFPEDEHYNNLNIDLGDSDYVSCEDIHRSPHKTSEMVHVIERVGNDINNRKHEESSRYSDKQGNSETSFFLGPAEREIWGSSEEKNVHICNKEDIEVDTTLLNIRHYPRVLTPGVPTMSAITEESENSKIYLDFSEKVTSKEISPFIPKVTENEQDFDYHEYSIEGNNNNRISTSILNVKHNKSFWDELLSSPLKGKEGIRVPPKPNRLSNKNLEFAKDGESMKTKHRSRRHPSILIPGIVSKWKRCFENKNGAPSIGDKKFSRQTYPNDERAEATNRQNMVSQWKQFWDELLINQIEKQHTSPISIKNKDEEKPLEALKQGIVASSRQVFEKQTGAFKTETIKQIKSVTTKPPSNRTISYGPLVKHNIVSEVNSSVSMPKIESMDTLLVNSKSCVNKDNSSLAHNSNKRATTNQSCSFLNGHGIEDWSNLKEKEVCSEKLGSCTSEVFNYVHLTEPMMNETDESTCDDPSVQMCIDQSVPEQMNPEDQELSLQNNNCVQRMSGSPVIDAVLPACPRTAVVLYSYSDKKDDITPNNSEKSRERYEQAKSFFQKLESQYYDSTSELTESHPRVAGSVTSMGNLWEVSQSDLWDKSVTRRHKFKGKKKEPRGIRSAPASDTETIPKMDRGSSSESELGGSERCKRVSERFHVRDLFLDVAGEFCEGSIGHGVPHREAVLAALRSVEEDLDRSGAVSPYEYTNLMDEHYGTSIATCPVPLSYQPEFPYLSNTPPNLYRSRINVLIYGLIKKDQCWVHCHHPRRLCGEGRGHRAIGNGPLHSRSTQETVSASPARNHTLHVEPQGCPVGRPLLSASGHYPRFGDQTSVPRRRTQTLTPVTKLHSKSSSRRQIVFTTQVFKSNTRIHTSPYRKTLTQTLFI